MVSLDLVRWLYISLFCSLFVCFNCHGQEFDYKLVEADVRNIIFVGRSRSGKTTLIEVLKEKNHAPGAFKMLRETKEAQVHTFTMTSKSTGKNLHFNIMDTPGLFERTEKLDDRRTNEVILDVIKKCIDKEITKINHVYFVMSIQQGLNDADLKSFDLFTQLFVGMEEKISVILSFSQQLSTIEQYNHFTNQFEHEVPELRHLYRKINGSIFFLGAAKQNDMMNMNKVRANVHVQRSRLFDHIIGQNTAFNVKQLKVYKDNVALIKEVRETLAECCMSIQKCGDIDLPKFDAFIAHYDSPIDDAEYLDDHDYDEYYDSNSVSCPLCCVLTIYLTLALSFCWAQY